jgi:hypothetical protein
VWRGPVIEAGFIQRADGLAPDSELKSPRVEAEGHRLGDIPLLARAIHDEDLIAPVENMGGAVRDRGLGECQNGHQHQGQK